MNNSKQKALNYIIKVMRRHNITADEIKTHLGKEKAPLEQPKLSDEFDVLCEINGKTKRVPFSQRTADVIGIFPFSDSPLYIELTEVNDKAHVDKDVDESRLPNDEFFERVAKVKERLNQYLEALKSPILDGCYLADSDYMQGCGWIVSFTKGEDILGSDYYGGSQKAKLRYVGRHQKFSSLRIF